MPHKRTRKGRRKRLIQADQRKEEYNLQKLKHEERTAIWKHAVWDHERDEVTNTIPCHHNFFSREPLDPGDVLTDSRNTGVFQILRIPAYGR